MKKSFLALLAVFIFVLAVVLGIGATQDEGTKKKLSDPGAVYGS